MNSTKGTEWEVRVYMREKFQLTPRRYAQMTEKDLQALYKRFTFEYPGIPEIRFREVLEISYK
jgi:hypothetical protein